ncbi:hypothetical protein [Marinomonas sp. THO17]|uniref:hypothetical protein n=1 Tax=Marinomonas sp. THO17 TaxID=3149048 RepID=UPI00336BE874
MDMIDIKDKISVADDQLAFLTKAFSYGIEVSENESRGVSHFLSAVRDALPKQESADVFHLETSKSYSS